MVKVLEEKEAAWESSALRPSSSTKVDEKYETDAYETTEKEQEEKEKEEVPSM